MALVCMNAVRLPGEAPREGCPSDLTLRGWDHHKHLLISVIRYLVNILIAHLEDGETIEDLLDIWPVYSSIPRPRVNRHQVEMFQNQLHVLTVKASSGAPERGPSYSPGTVKEAPRKEREVEVPLV